MTPTIYTTRSLHDELMTPNYAPAQMVPVRGKGVRIWDQSGKMYWDLAAGVAVNALGHAHPAMIEALTQQAHKLWHVSSWFTTEPLITLAKTLIDNTFAERVFFANSGAEANEAALKLARRYASDTAGPQKNRILSTFNAFHGRTLFTVTAGGTDKYKQGFGPLPEGITHVPFNDIQSLEVAMDDTVCALILEPIQGEGGIHSATSHYLKAVRELCDKHGALLILDEIQTGIGRTGTLYNYMQKGIIPDILTTAKGLGGGFPISAMLTTHNIASSLSLGSHGSTYGGNTLACAVAKTVIDHVNQPELFNNVKARHVQFKEGLRMIGNRLGCFNDIRGEGLLMGAELSPLLQGQALSLMRLGEEKGVLFLMAGPNVLRFAPALTIQENELSEALHCLEQTLQQAILEVQ